MSRFAPVWFCAALALAGTDLARATDRYVAWGDSITEGFLDDKNLGGYPGRLESWLNAEGRDVVVENWGLGGERTSEALSRINTVSGSAADTFILMEGTNDCIGTKLSIETIQANLGLLLDKARARGFGKVMLATILPISTKASNKQAPGRARRLSESLRQYGYEQLIDRPDAERGMADLPDLFNTYYADKKLHPNGIGYDKLADIFLDYIQGRDTQAPAPSFVTPGANSIVPPDELLQVVLFDPSSGVDFATSQLVVDGVPVATDVTGDAHRAVLSARPGNLSGTTSLGVSTSDLANPSNQRDELLVQFTIEPGAPIDGDINLSGRVDGVDLVLLARAFGAQQGSLRYLAAADLDHDGTVDGTDLALLAANFGEGSV